MSDNSYKDYIDHGDSSFILVLGVMGSGKSSFIHQLVEAEAPKPEISRNVYPQTRTIDEYPLQLRDKAVVLVDTPGLDVAEDMLEVIGNWMTDRAVSFDRIGGLVFLHPINANRINMSPYRQVLDKIFGTGKGILYGQVALSTSMWNDATPDRVKPMYQQREELLKRKIWRPLQKKGAMVVQYKNNVDSARGIIEAILQAKRPDHERRPRTPPATGRSHSLPLLQVVSSPTRWINPIFGSYAGKFVILLLGPSGSGKSTFIARATGRPVTIGNGLRPCTRKINVYAARLVSGHQVFLVDTPGYDDQPPKVLRRVRKWLLFQNRWNIFRRKKKITFSSVLLFHRMSISNRVPVPTQQYVSSFRILCNGNDTLLDRVHLVTTTEIQMGGNLVQLQGDFWNANGFRVSNFHQFNNDESSATTILAHAVGDQQVGEVPLPEGLLSTGLARSPP